ncbi:hypothetical protein ANO11243_039240 [Dothideomycetidae sp. 11243]|nr:hypothetical protein ANO11243_039240 [fungal sp. No.11243]
MEERKAAPPEFTLSLLADRSSVKEIVKAVLHTIFFHRYFTAVTPVTVDVCDMTLPGIAHDAELAVLIDARAATLAEHFSSSSPSSPSAPPRGTLVLQFLERRRRPSTTTTAVVKGWFATTRPAAARDEDLVWETWSVEVVLACPRTDTEVVKARRAMESSLSLAVRKVVDVVNRERGHIPPITTNESNPFPYQILVNPKSSVSEGWGARQGIF